MRGRRVTAAGETASSSAAGDRTSLDAAGLSLAEALDNLRARRLSARELFDACRSRIGKFEPVIRAFITPTFELAGRAADEADDRYRRGGSAALDGVPVGVKDQFETAGVRTTFGSRALRRYVPEKDATAWRRLSAAGAGLMGKLNTHELGLGSETPPTRNPWDPRKVPGGSSGGSAAAVAARFVPLALGADAAGSVRTPAALCGCVGLKPTSGLISRNGLLGGPSSFGDAGTLTRTVSDAALALGLLAGHDPGDPESLHADPPEYPTVAPDSLAGRRIGVPAPLLWEGVEESIESVSRRAVTLLEELGAEVVEVELPASFRAFAAPEQGDCGTDPALGLLTGYPLALVGAEGAAHYYSQRRRNPGEFSAEVHALLGAAERMSAVEYLNASRLRERFVRDLRELFSAQRLDAIVHPTVRRSPPDQRDHGPLDDAPRSHVERALDVAVSRLAPSALGVLARRRVYGTLSRLSSGLLESLGISAPEAGAEVWNACGFPSLSVPVGLDDRGIPVGLLLNGPPLAEPRLLEIGLALEAAAGFGSPPPLERAG